MMADGSTIPSWDPERSVSRRLDRLRHLLSSERHDGVDQQRALDVFDQEMSDRSGDAYPPTVNERRRRETQAQLQDQTLNQDPDTAAVVDGLPSSGSPSSLIRSRRRAFRPSQRLQRHRDAHEHTTRAEQPENVGNSRRENPPAFTDTAMDEYLTEAQMNRDQRYRAKRRRLNDGTFDDESRVVSYGDRGRVVPGQLKLEVVSCDGGEHARNPDGMAQHVLQDDNLVYSTKDNRCNMLLKHVGGMPFSLTRIVFKAPKTGYDAPVQEGMLFIAMDDEQLLEKTAEYETRYSPKSYRQHHTQRRHDLYRPSQQYLQTSGQPLPPLDRTRYLRDPYGHQSWSRHGDNNPELEASQAPGFEVSFSDPSDNEDTASQVVSPENLYQPPGSQHNARTYADRYRPNYNRDPPYVDLSASSSGSDEEETHLYQGDGIEHERSMEISINRQRDLLHRMQAARNQTGSHTQVSRSSTPLLPREWRELQTFICQRGSSPSPVRSSYNFPGSCERQGSKDSQASSATKNHAGGTPSRTSGASSSSVTLAPHARFFIRKTKTAVAVNFDPPVAGRYLLIKLWSSCPNGNIDIKSIIATGYGGPRFFPNIELR